MKTQVLRQEHQALLKLVGDLSTGIQATACDAALGKQCRDQLVQLGAQLNIHLIAEDKMVYPDLAAGKDAVAAETARRFMAEMGQIGEAFKKFMKKYPAGATIEAQYAVFCADLKEIFKVIGARITREEAELYPLVDKTM
ncbi:MAG: hemerythrin domain-containing protein [Spirochaetes bacterium]|nr:hemerythrin domain-containing protein [Spirochaetota bacterium]